MAQTAAVYVSDDGVVDHVAAAAITAGDVVEVGTRPLIAKHDIAITETGALSSEGIFDVPKTSDAFSAGDTVYWNSTGNPVTGTAGTGAADGATGNLMGMAVAAALAGDSYVRVELSSSRVSTTIAGALTTSGITGDDSSLGVSGLSDAQGGAVAILGGPSSTAGNAGGAVTITGGVPGVTGAGGAVSVAGGAGGATSGTGGAVAIAGGAGTAGNANGGAVSILAGNAHGSGTDGVLSLGTSNTSAINIGAASIVTRNAGYSQANGNAAVTATVGGGTTGLIPAGASFVTVTSDNADKQISLPAGTVGDTIKILVGTTACELISAVAADKVNEVTVGATNELALTAESLYTCTYTKSGFWIVTGVTKLGAAEAALVPDVL